MRAKGFLTGISAGLVAGLMIIGYSGLSYGTFGSFTPASVRLNSDTSSATTTTTMSSTSAVPGSVYNATLSETSTQTQATSPSNPSNQVSGLDFAPSNPPSHLEAIAGQPTALTGVVIVPIVVGVLLGLLLYRGSRTAEEKD
ncbi:MAG: hypothetical protein HY296_02185 [Thaumarchaeota archaeon]|nr:hypothetical protein [Nitrososphaerota archaeon]